MKKVMNKNSLVELLQANETAILSCVTKYTGQLGGNLNWLLSFPGKIFV